MELRVLGPLELMGPNGVVALAGGKLRAVLALLAVHVGESVSEDRLAEVLWGDSPPRTATKTLQSYVSRLRRVLADGDDGLAVETTPDGYRLRAAAADVLDVARVEALAAQAREAVERGDHPWAAVALSEALRTWRGVPLEEFAGEPWADSEATRLAEMRVLLIEERVDADLACGRHAVLVPELEALTAQFPLRERLWAQRMTALYRTGRQADALRVFQQVRTMLAEEVGIEPSHELRELELRILDQDRTLDWAPLDPPVTEPPAPRMPTGVVTFLLTDVEGSTALWERDPEAMAIALAQHEAQVRDAVDAHQGTVVKSRGEGDSSFSVFATAEAAANAAIAIQSARSGDQPIRVRIGIHTGEADERDGDYFGPTLNRAARLRDVAHGGQTLCSSVTGQLLLDAVRRVKVIDLGEHRLRDLGRADRIFQIGDGAFPPLRTTGAHRHNLPTHATTFVGRKVDVEDIAAMLEQNRLVVLTGVGGVGKTRLALEVAESYLDRTREGVYFVDLAPVSDPLLVIPTIANVLPAVFSADTTDEMLTFLAQRDALVVLDNCEHLIDACADLLAEFLARGSTGRVLATTREAFGLPGERVWQVASLDRDESRNLFAARASAIRQSFAIDQSNASAVDEICRRLDGIPLAIELAAARVAHLSPQQIADRLGDRFTLLTGGRGRVQRQHTLQATLDWSHDLLEPAEQVLLRRLGVFNGSFTLEAVEGICSDNELASVSVLDLLGALVDQSIVGAQDDGRFRLLETVRLYAEQKLTAAGESETYRDRQLQWYLDWAESLVAGQGRTTDVAKRQELDFPNLSAAVSWALSQERNGDAGRLAVATAPMWMYSSRSHEAAHWLRSALADPFLEPDLQVACYACHAHAGMLLLNDDVFHLARSAVRVQGAAPSGPLALAWGILASMAGSRAAVRAQPDDPALDNAVAEVRALDLQPNLWIAEALNLCAEGLMIAGRHAEAVVLAAESVECATDAGFLQVMWNSRSVSMIAWHLLGNHERAMAEATRLQNDRALRSGVAMSSFGAHEAVVLAADGQGQRARAIALEALSAADDPAIPLWEVEVLLTLAVVEAIDGRARRAAVLLAAGRELGRHYPGGFRTPMSWALYAHYVPLVRAALAPAEARAARAQGRAMTLEDAIRYARWESDTFQPPLDP